MNQYLDKTTRAWAVIHRENLEKNYHYLRSLAPDSAFLGVVKADAYGHGDLTISTILEDLGAEMLAVACASEGATLRQKGISLPILILGETPPILFPLLSQYQLTASIHQPTQAQTLLDFAKESEITLPVHVKVDTGMGRLGFQEQQFPQLVSLCKEKHFHLDGLFTHFSQSEEDNGEYYTREQYKKFQNTRKKLEKEGITFSLYHCANSGATLHHKETHLDMIRPGIALYGYDPSGCLNPQLLPVLSLHSRIVSIREMKQGERIGYGSDHLLNRDCKVGVLAIGYGDGYPRCFSSQMDVEIHGVPCPLMGRICMDMTMVDLSPVAEIVEVGDVATLYGTQSQLEIGARLGQSISYELLCQLTPRIPRILES